MFSSGIQNISDQGTATNASKNESFELYRNAKMKSIQLQHNLEQICDLQTSLQEFKNKINSEQIETRTKSVLRQKQPILVETLSVDKWLESKQKKTAGQFNKTQSYKPVSTKNKASNRTFSNFQDTIDQSYSILNAFRSKKSNNKYNINDVNSLNQIQKKLNCDLKSNIEIIRRINLQSQFNNTVSKVKLFLDELEKFNEKSTFPISDFTSSTPFSLRQSQINLYKYEFLLKIKN